MRDSRYWRGPTPGFTLADTFSVDTHFSALVDDEEITIHLVADGHFLNRPPIADFGAFGDGVFRFPHPRLHGPEL